MQSDVKTRLVQFLAYLNIGQKTFAESVGLSAGFVNAIRVSIQPKTLEKISARYPQLNTAWLLTGEGEMLKGQTVTQNVGNGNSNFSNTGDVTDGVPLSIHEKALNEIAEQRKLVAKGQEQIDRLLAIIEKMTK